GVDGLITIEDLVEEIVGEIEDEHDQTVQPQMTFNEDGTILAEARLEVKELETLTGRLLEDDDRDEIDTLGGLVCAVAGRVPGRGEVVRHPSGLQFEVVEGDPRRLALLKIRGVSRQSQNIGD
ncbi:MAG: transporter associated domain-containing protein, partial [Rhodobiaceae bacterium]